MRVLLSLRRLYLKILRLTWDKLVYPTFIFSIFTPAVEYPVKHLISLET